MNNDLTSSVVIRKDIFIASRQEDIIKHYQFLPKVQIWLPSFWAEEPMESSTGQKWSTPLIHKGQ